MTSELENAEKVLIRYAEHWTFHYKERWMPTQDHIRVTLELFKSPIAGFDAYTAEDALARLDEFFKCKETWLVASRHNYSVFIKHFHRWVDPKKQVTRQSNIKLAEGKKFCSDCPPDSPTELPANGICPKCFPLCAQCKIQHAPNITCEEQAQFEVIAKRIVEPDRKRGNEAKQISELIGGVNQ